MTSSLRVGFDGRDLLRKRTGVVNYAVHLARALGSRSDAELLVYADAHHDPTVPAPPASVPLKPIRAPSLLWKHAALPFALWRDHVDVFHSPTGTLPLLAPCRQVVTIHDVFAAIEPGWFAPRVGAQLRAAQRRAAHGAEAVIAVSECTRRDVVERYRADPGRVHVVYNGVDHDRFGPSDVEVDGEAVARRYGVRHPFILCVGSLMPWRNATRLLRAASRLDYGLLFVGRDVWGTDPTQQLAAQHGWDWARFTGYVDDDDLPTLYAAASVFAYPSLYEGFGIPPLEAMACGTPVVASTAGALPEVLGDAALLVDPYDEDQLAQAIDAAARDSGELRRRGFLRAQRYTWSEAAERTWQVYRNAVA